MATRKNKRAKACDIPPKVKAAVWERDNGCCILCGSPNAAPNAHCISRAQGGLGVEENVVTLCHSCHHEYDNGGFRMFHGARIRAYLQGIYPDWDDSKLIYRKWGQA